MAGRFPRAYSNTVPEEGTEPCMEYTSFPTMGYGARKSALPKDGKKPNSIEHVGMSSGGKK